MAVQQKKQTVYSAGTPYVGGSTALKTEQTGNVRSRKNNNARRARQGTGTAMNIRYVAFITGAIVLSGIFCLLYLYLHTQYTSLQSRETALVSELDDLTRENDAAYNRIMSSVNLEEIRDIAMNKLEMVYAKEDQIIRYDAPESDYVKQYLDVSE